MNIDVKDTITLSDNNKYVVCGKINSYNVIYYCIVDINNNKNLKFCFEDGNELVEVEDSVMIQGLLPLFENQAIEILNSIKNNEQ